jgi:hypothetical protein
MTPFKSLWPRTLREKTKRPVLNIPRTPFEMSLELIAAGAVVLACALLAQAWPAVPDRVPQHFGPTGQPDTWGGKQILWVLPAVAAGNYLLMTIVSRFPHTFNYPWPITVQNAEAQYVLGRTLMTALKAEIGALLVFLEWKTIAVALGRSKGLGEAFLPVFMGVMALTIGLYFLRAYQAR